MNKFVKNGFYTSVGFFLIGLNNVNALAVGQGGTLTAGDNVSDGDFMETLNNMLTYIISLLYFITIVFALYGGFQILTAGGDEEKVKKGKTTLINAVIGLVVIFLASNIIRWIIDLMSTGGGGVG